MSHASPPSSNETSHTSEAIAHHHNPLPTYLKVFAALMILLIVTVLATLLPTHGRASKCCSPAGNSRFCFIPK